MRHFLSYWKPTRANLELGLTLDHSAAGSYGRVKVKKGDAVWIVTARSGVPSLLGRILVGRILNQRTTERLLRRTNFYKAKYHVIAAEGTAMDAQDVPIARLVRRLRFESKAGKTRLSVANGRISAQELQQVRILTPASSDLLEEALSAGADHDVHAELDEKPILRWPEELASDVSYFEGAVRSVRINVYERHRDARRACIAEFGSACNVCHVNFGRAYGERGRDFIHVHHLRSLSKIGKKYKLDPIRDLRPVCPNCHAMLHCKPALKIEELQQVMMKLRGRKKGRTAMARPS